MRDITYIDKGTYVKYKLKYNIQDGTREMCEENPPETTLQNAAADVKAISEEAISASHMASIRIAKYVCT